MKQSQYTIQDSKEGQIDLALLWSVFIGNLWKILLVGVLCAGLLGSFRFFTTSVTYTSSVKFLINGMTLTKIDNEYTYIAGQSSSSATGSQFAKNAPHIIGEDNTLEKVRNYLITEKPDSPYADLYQKYTNRNISGMLRVSYDEQIVLVSVTHPNPDIAVDVADAFRHVVPGQMDYFFGIENKYSSSTTSTPNESTDSLESSVQSPNNSEYENIKSVAKALNTVSKESTSVTGRGAVLYAAIGFLLGAIVVFLICFLRARFDNTVYTEDDLKNYFTLPVVGQIPGWDNESDSGNSYSNYDTSAYASAAAGAQSTAKKSKDKKKQKKAKKKVQKNTKNDSRNSNENPITSDRDYSGRLLNEKTPFAITEAFKSLRTNMCYTTKGEKCAVYGITSAYVQAGKSLVIANLAVSFSMMDKKVLLLDGDLRCPVQHKIFNLSNHVHGFSDVLAGICSYEDIEIRNGGYPNLNILTCGKLPPNPAELLASENMKDFIERARKDYDFIFIDLPPVSEVSDAGIISELVTGFAFVVRAAYSDRRMVELALESMEGFEAPLTGFILNDIDIKSGNYYKNKYYSYGGKYSKYSKYSKYGSYSKYGKYSKYSKYSRYGSYGEYGNAATKETNPTHPTTD